MKTFLWFAIFTLMSFRLSAETITAAGDPWPPFLDPDVPSQGVSFEIASQAFASQGYNLTMKFVPWARAINGVKDATFDVLISTWYTKERATFLEFSNPYLENAVKFIKIKGDKFEYSDLNSLKGLSVGVVRGYGYGDDFLNSKKFLRPPTKDLVTNIRKLIAGRINLTLEDELVARSLIAKADPSLLSKIEFTQHALSIKKVFVTAGLANAKHKEIIAAFNKGLIEIKQNGIFDKILRKNGLK